MHAVRIHKNGGREVLQVEDVPRPAPGSDELLVRVQAASVNPVDIKYRERTADDLPRIAGSDLAGTVESVGERVTEYEPGDRVYGTALHNNAVPTGSFADYVAVPTDLVAPLPDTVSTASGAALALVGVTAWRALRDRAALEPGEVCLVHGGNGGVGHVAIQLASASGAEVLTTARPRYHDRLEALGADRCFDYTVADLEDRVTDAVPAGVDVVLDHRYDEYAGFDFAVAAFGADIVAIDGGEATVDAGVGRAKELSVHHLGMDNLLRPELPSISSVLRRLARLAEKGSVRAEVAKEWPLDAVSTAQERVVTDSFLGKLVLRPSVAEDDACQE